MWTTGTSSRRAGRMSKGAGPPEPRHRAQRPAIPRAPDGERRADGVDVRQIRGLYEAFGHATTDLQQIGHAIVTTARFRCGGKSRCCNVASACRKANDFQRTADGIPAACTAVPVSATHSSGGNSYEIPAKESRRRSRVRVGGAAMIAGAPVLAQDVVRYVTGSNVKRTDVETSAPIQTITREDIQETGLQTISEVVRQITANNNGSISDSFTNGFSAGGSGVSLRGLGPNNTLVLVNGRRMAHVRPGGRRPRFLRRPAADPVRGRRAHRGAQGRRVRDLRVGRGRRRGQHHPAPDVHRRERQRARRHELQGRRATITRRSIAAGMGDLTKDRYNVFVDLRLPEGQRRCPSNTRRGYIGLERPDVHGSAATSGRAAGVRAVRRNGQPERRRAPGQPGHGRDSRPVPAAAAAELRAVATWTPTGTAASRSRTTSTTSRRSSASTCSPAGPTTSATRRRATPSCRISTSRPTRERRRPHSGPRGRRRGRARSTHVSNWNGLDNDLPAGRTPRQPVQCPEPGGAHLLHDRRHRRPRSRISRPTRSAISSASRAPITTGTGTSPRCTSRRRRTTRARLPAVRPPRTGDQRNGPLRLLPRRRRTPA